MPRGGTRVAVCQLECHPALTIADFDYLREPVVPPDRSLSLAGLSRHSLDFAGLQGECERRYLAWHEARVQAVLAFLASFTKVPDLIVFPEASLPLSLLPAVRAFARTHKATVFAGTHALRLTHASRQQYTDLGLKTSTQKTWAGQPWPCTAVLPIFNGDKSSFHRKKVPSVFEITDVTRADPAGYELMPLAMRVGGQELRTVPVVCAEALQHHAVPGSYDLVVVCTYNADTAPFKPFINHHVQNRIPVILCNDGRYGGSGIHVPTDRRMNLWWQEEAEGELPRGDSILVADIEWAHLAPQVGVADPKPALQLVAVAGIVYEDAEDDAFPAAAATTAIAQRGDNGVQQELLSQVSTQRLSAIQRMKVGMLLRLARAGTAWSPASRTWRGWRRRLSRSSRRRSRECCRRAPSPMSPSSAGWRGCSGSASPSRGRRRNSGPGRFAPRMPPSTGTARLGRLGRSSTTLARSSASCSGSMMWENRR